MRTIQSYMKQLMFEEYWTLAYREKREPDDHILNNRKVAFRLFEENKRYWYADPFLFEHMGRTYLFFEMFDRWSGKGKIAYSTLSASGASEPKVVLSGEHHLSFPFLFQDGENIYLIPEEAKTAKVALYRAESFPDVWNLEKVLLRDFEGTDNAVFESGEDRWLMSSRPVDGDVRRQQLYLYEMDSSLELIAHQDNPQSDGSTEVRAAGGIVRHADKHLRPVQQGADEDYGRSIVFRELLKLDKSEFLESDYRRFVVEDILLDGDEPGTRYVGLHTYNQSEHYEVVDLKVKRRYPLIWGLANLVHLIRRFCLRRIRVARLTDTDDLMR